MESSKDPRIPKAPGSPGTPPMTPVQYDEYQRTERRLAHQTRLRQHSMQTGAKTKNTFAPTRG